MSYGGPPKTAYGDQDFIKEDTVPTTTMFGSPPGPPLTQPLGASYQAPPIAGQVASPYAQPSPYGQLPVGYQGFEQNPPGARVPRAASGTEALLSASQSMTQEDLLFMKSWRQYTFYYRVLPITAIANGAYFFYNKQKNLPHKPLKYSLLSVACYLFSVYTSRGELRRRVQESNLNTPFMQAMKRFDSTGVLGPISEFAQDYSPLQQDPSASWTTTGDGFSRRPYPPPEQPSSYFRPPTTAAYNQPPYNVQPGGSDMSQASGFDEINRGNNPQDGDLAPRPATSYEELRARNRGLAPPRQL